MRSAARVVLREPYFTQVVRRIEFADNVRFAFFGHDGQNLLELAMPLRRVSRRSSAAPQKFQMEFGSKHVQQQIVDFRIGQNDFGVTAEGGKRTAEVAAAVEVRVPRTQALVRSRCFPLVDRRPR